jgi:hypothetical protein
MPDKRALIQVWICFGLILANFIAQIPYFFHLYLGTQSLSADFRSFLIMGAVFALFLVGSIQLFKRQRLGYWLMILFLSTEFLFYLRNTIGSVIHGYGLFFQILNPDLILKIVYGIGYINLFASGYFLFLLIHERDAFLIG